MRPNPLLTVGAVAAALITLHLATRPWIDGTVHVFVDVPGEGPKGATHTVRSRVSSVDYRAPLPPATPRRKQRPQIRPLAQSLKPNVKKEHMWVTWLSLGWRLLLVGSLMS